MIREVPPSAIEDFVPGRVCLLGEHSDWAGQHTASNGKGKCLVYNTDVGIHAWAWTTEDSKLLIIEKTSHGEEITFTAAMDSGVLRSSASDPSEYFSYICGSVAVMLDAYPTYVKGRGLVIYNDMTTVPMRKGFSSSAAICVLVVKVFNRVFSCPDLSIDQVMDFACQGEWATPSRCGRMDQCVAFGPQAVVAMDFFPPKPESPFGVSHTAIKVKSGFSFYFVVADLCKGKDTQAILADLQEAFGNGGKMPISEISGGNHLSSQWPESVQQLYSSITESINPENSIRKFLSAENSACAALAERALEQGDAEVLGSLMTLCQHRFDLCMGCWSTELKSPRLHQVLDNVSKLKGLTFGGKGVGSQGDGSVQFVCQSPEGQTQLVDYLTRVEGCHAFQFTVTGF